MTTLVLAPHADDEVLGVGGTIARLARGGESVVVAVITGQGGEDDPRWPAQAWATVRNECRIALEILGVDEVAFRELPAARLDVTPAWQVNETVAELLDEYRPENLFVPFPFDLHKDHGAVSYAATVASRPYLDRSRPIKRVLAYETLTETHLAPPYLSPSFSPNCFVDISETLQLKLDAMRAYRSQLQPSGMPRSVEALAALAKLRGAHMGCSAGEAFVLLGAYLR